VSGLPDPATFLSGERGAVEGRRARLRARAGDLWLDALLSLRGTARRLEDGPPREVLVMSIYRPESERLSDAGRELESEHHRVRYAFGSTAADTLPHTVATGLGGGKFENLNGVLAAADGTGRSRTSTRSMSAPASRAATAWRCAHTPLEGSRRRG